MAGNIDIFFRNCIYYTCKYRYIGYVFQTCVEYNRGGEEFMERIIDVAQYIYDEYKRQSGEVIDEMKLHKLLYFA